MTTRKSLLATIGLILPLATVTLSPAQAQSDAPKSAKRTHHIVHKHIHKAKAHITPTTAKTVS